MDVFKLLSRSAKAPKALPTQNIPSAGAAANPQLFGHDAVAPAPETSKKRKRRRGQDVAEEAPALPEELDFFSEPTKGRKKKSKTDAATNDVTEESTDFVPEKEEAVEAAEEEAEVYDEDECKKLLRLHKLKVVVLEDFAGQEEAEEEDTKKKKSKKRKLEKEVAPEKGKKKDKMQLFPRPLTEFSQLRTRYAISRRLAQNLDEQGYKMPTEVQLAALPLLLGAEKSGGKQSDEAKVEVDASGRHLRGDFDLLTVAPTGSGKTIAFLIPIINGLLSESKSTSESTSGIRAIIVAPTRELASQIVNEARKLAKGTGIKTALMKKGMEVVERSGDVEAPEVQDASEASDDNESRASDSEHEEASTQTQKQKQPRRRDAVVKAAILVTTPLALLNALRRPGGKIAELPTVRYLVLDEADVLLDPLFREQTLALWNACNNPLLRVGLWSATMGSSIEALTIDTLNSRWKALSSTTGLPPRPPLIRAVVGLKDTAIPNITHKLVYAATEQGKLLGLRQLLHPTDIPSTDTAPALRPPFLVFTQTIPRAMALHSELLYDIPAEAGGSSRIAVLHANLSSSARSDVMTRFRRGEIWVLITTDLLSRGVDFRGLNGVVNYDVPNSAAAYVHRVGRTGRAGRTGGVAVTFYTQEDVPYVKNVANVIRASEALRGDGAHKNSIQQWLLDALPTPSKRDKQQLKKRGNEARRTVKDQEGKTTARISTKSGYERRVENNIKGARKANAAREGPRVVRRVEAGGGGASESEFEGFE